MLSVDIDGKKGNGSIYCPYKIKINLGEYI